MIDDKRKNRRRHIKAASDWLIQAEKSIESKNDVQGDLKIMLAKAELQNAENHRSKTPLKKFLMGIILFLMNSGKNMRNSKEK